MHIALLSNHLHYPWTGFGGVERWSLYLADGFIRAGHQVTLLANAPADKLPPHPELNPQVQIVPLGQRKLLAAWRGRRWLSKVRPEVLLSGSHRFNLMADAMRGKRQQPVWICAIHENLSMAAAQAAPKRRARRGTELLRTNRADALVAVSHDVQRDAAAAWRLQAEKLLTIYNPIVDDAWLASAAGPSPHPWLEDASVPVITTAGRLTEQKGLDDLIDAFARLRARRPCRLLVLGEGKLRAALQARIDELDVAEDAALLGHLDQPAAAIARSQVFALTSRWEGFGNVLPEAMSLGVPVVATDCPSGPREILEDGQWGPLVPVGDVAAIADGLEQALMAPVDRQALALRGQHFSVQRSVDAYLALFERLTASRAPQVAQA